MSFLEAARGRSPACGRSDQLRPSIAITKRPVSGEQAWLVFGERPRLITEALLRARLEARDRLLLPLQKSLESLMQNISDPMQCLKTLADLALDADRRIDRLFWLAALADQIRQQPDSRHPALLRFVAQRIHATFAVDHRDRQAAVRFLCTKVMPLA